MKKNLSITLLLPTLLSGCAVLGMQPIKSTTIAVDDVKVDPVKVTLTQKFENPNFYTDEEMSQYMTQCLVQNLTEAGIYKADSENTLSTNVSYARIYSGQTLGKSESITSPTLGYDYVVKKSTGDNVILQDFDENLLTYDETFLKNAKSLFMVDNKNTAKGDEDKYLKALCARITYKFLTINDIGKKNALNK